MACMHVISIYLFDLNKSSCVPVSSVYMACMHVISIYLFDLSFCVPVRTVEVAGVELVTACTTHRATPCIFTNIRDTKMVSKI